MYYSIYQIDNDFFALDYYSPDKNDFGYFVFIKQFQVILKSPDNKNKNIYLNGINENDIKNIQYDIANGWHLEIYNTFIPEKIKLKYKKFKIESLSGWEAETKNEEGNLFVEFNTAKNQNEYLVNTNGNHSLDKYIMTTKIKTGYELSLIPALSDQYFSEDYFEDDANFMINSLFVIVHFQDILFSDARKYISAEKFIIPDLFAIEKIYKLLPSYGHVIKNNIKLANLLK